MKKSLLRYPGGKTRAVKHILPYFPENLKELCSPFFGGGSIELALANKGVQVYGYDAFEPVVAFWTRLRHNPEDLYALVKYYKENMDKNMFYNLRDSLKDHLSGSKILFDNEVAAMFYVLNRASFSGTVLSGGYSPEHPRFTDKSVLNILNFDVKNFRVRQADFEISITSHMEEFLYCDPPYYLKKKSKLYGNSGDLHKDFDHEKLAELLTSRDGWILSYNNCPEIKELYKGYEFLYPDWKYGMSKDKDSKEILIVNY